VRRTFRHGRACHGHPRRAKIAPVAGVRADVGRLGLPYDEPPQRRPLHRGKANIARHAYEHREGLVPGFTRRNGLKRPIKHRSRAWKAQMIVEANPGWLDLYETLNQQAHLANGAKAPRSASCPCSEFIEEVTGIHAVASQTRSKTLHDPRSFFQ
jgi:putative endonuclease